MGTKSALVGKRPVKQAPYKGVVTTSLYIPMRDGVRIAVDAMRPRNAPPDAQFPTILIMARYWRSFELRGWAPSNRAPIGPRQNLPDFLVSQGYAVVCVDSRGSGASSGTTPYPFNPAEIEDYGEVVDWIVRQPWSDGRVGATGISYEGVTAQLLPVARPDATAIVMPQEIEIDNYTDTFFPGGLFLESFARLWQETNADLDRNRVPSAWGWMTRWMIKGVRPVDADRDRVQLRRAVADHAGNPDVYAAAKAITFRDDPFGTAGVTLDDFSVLHHRDAIERSGVPIACWGSWLDGNSADTVIRTFAGMSNPVTGIIGAWSHRYLNHASPLAPSRRTLRPTLPEIWQEMLVMFDRHLREAGATAENDRRLFYYTMGEEDWKVTDVWPPAGSRTQRWYLAEDNALSPTAPGGEGADRYAVDFEATSGLANRWRSLDGVTKVRYPDRANADRRLLVYTGPALDRDTEITGYPIVTLFVTSTETDGALFAYLEDVDPHGRVTYLTEGQLRLLHRRVCMEPPPLPLFVPHHSFRRRDAMPLEPGEVAEVTFGLLPVSVRVRKGHRLRIALAGHDKDSFARVPADGHPVLTFHRSADYPSRIDLPVVGPAMAW